MPAPSPSPGDRVRVEVLLGVVLPEQLHPQDGEDVDHNEEDEREVSEGAEGGDDDAEEDLHCCPGLGQLKDAHLESEELSGLLAAIGGARSRWELV